VVTHNPKRKTMQARLEKCKKCTNNIQGRSITRSPKEGTAPQLVGLRTVPKEGELGKKFPMTQRKKEKKEEEDENGNGDAKRHADIDCESTFSLNGKSI